MQVKNNLTMKDFLQMNEMEKMFYSEEHISPPEEAQKWYEKFPNSTIVMEDKGKIIGFADVFPLKDHIFESLIKGTFNDKNLNADCIQDMDLLKSGDSINMFICCLVIIPEYRKSEVLNNLLKAHIEYYDKYVKKGIKIDNIVGDTVTGDGERFCEKMGFIKVIETNYETVIYIKSYEDYIKMF